MRKGFGAGLVAALACVPAMPASAQSHGSTAHAPAPPPDVEGDEDIVVNGRRAPQPGAVVGDIPPELQYSPADIRALGVDSISDLLNELGPEIRSDRGRGGEAPVVLLNGRRISGFSEIRDVPTEAILRVDILPEEVALKYGYSADQRVVNIVLRRRFRALTADGGGGTTTEGGAENGNGHLDLTRIRGDDRFQLDLRAKASAGLTEAQRGLADAGRSARPYDTVGNVVSPTGGEIDPALSALAGQPVTIAGVPAGVAAGARPTLDAFANTAGIANVTDVSPDRTLAPDNRDLTLNTVYAHPLGERVTATLNGTLDRTTSVSLRGLPGAALLVPAADPFTPFVNDVAVDRYLGTDPLAQRVRTLTSHLGFGLNADAGKWRLSVTGSWDHADTATRTATGRDTSALAAALAAGDPTVNPFGALPGTLIGGFLHSTARAVSDSESAQAVANGPLFDLPAGPLAASLKAGWTDSAIDTRSDRFGLVQRASLSRRDWQGQVNLDLPIASRTRDVLPFLGQLSANLNTAVNDYSDFGAEYTLGYGLNWTPHDGLSLIASTTRDHGIPSPQQLAGPAVVTPDVRVFDALTGRTVDVAETAGANPDLRADTRRVRKIEVNWKPLKSADLTLSANYVSSTIRNAIAAFPSPTAQVELAFPDRFTRDADGDLTAIDVRPLNFARERRDELRWGVNYTRRLKSSPRLVEAYRDLFRQRFQQQQAVAAAKGETPTPRPDLGSGGEGYAGGGRPGGGGGGGGRGGFGGRGGASGGRIQLSVYHTVFFRDDILVQPGGPVLDLLNGGATGTGGGQPRHEVEVQAGYSNNGVGARLTGQWESATRLDAGPGSPTGDLRFSALATANARVFLDFGSMPALARKPWARGLRFTASLTNITDSRQRVRDATGATPLAYQPAYLDPLGRSLLFSVRKLFY